MYNVCPYIPFARFPDEHTDVHRSRYLHDRGWVGVSTRVSLPVVIGAKNESSRVCNELVEMRVLCT